MVDLGGLREELERSGRVRFAVRVIPKSSRNEIAGFMDDGTLKLKIAAAPEKGKANAAVRELLAREFHVSRGAVEIVHGETSQRKQISISRE
jgi:uncharacterized protein (TIGR00251 family)